MVTTQEVRQQLQQQEQAFSEAERTIQTYPTRIPQTAMQLRQATPQSQAQVRAIESQRAAEKERALQELQTQKQQFEREAQPIREQIAAQEAAEEEYAKAVAAYEKEARQKGMAYAKYGTPEKKFQQIVAGATPEEVFTKQQLKELKAVPEFQSFLSDIEKSKRPILDLPESVYQDIYAIEGGRLAKDEPGSEKLRASLEKYNVIKQLPLPTGVGADIGKIYELGTSEEKEKLNRIFTKYNVIPAPELTPAVPIAKTPLEKISGDISKLFLREPKLQPKRMNVLSSYLDTGWMNKRLKESEQERRQVTEKAVAAAIGAGRMYYQENKPIVAGYINWLNQPSKVSPISYRVPKIKDVYGTFGDTTQIERGIGKGAIAVYNFLQQPSTVPRMEKYRVPKIKDVYGTFGDTTPIEKFMGTEVAKTYKQYSPFIKRSFELGVGAIKTIPPRFKERVIEPTRSKFVFFPTPYQRKRISQRESVGIEAQQLINRINSLPIGSEERQAAIKQLQSLGFRTQTELTVPGQFSFSYTEPEWYKQLRPGFETKTEPETYTSFYIRRVGQEFGRAGEVYAQQFMGPATTPVIGSTPTTATEFGKPIYGISPYAKTFGKLVEFGVTTIPYTIPYVRGIAFLGGTAEAATRGPVRFIQYAKENPLEVGMAAAYGGYQGYRLFKFATQPIVSYYKDIPKGYTYKEARAGQEGRYWDIKRKPIPSVGEEPFVTSRYRQWLGLKPKYIGSEFSTLSEDARTSLIRSLQKSGMTEGQIKKYLSSYKRPATFNIGTQAIGDFTGTGEFTRAGIYSPGEQVRVLGDWGKKFLRKGQVNIYTNFAKDITYLKPEQVIRYTAEKVPFGWKTIRPINFQTYRVAEGVVQVTPNVIFKEAFKVPEAGKKIGERFYQVEVFKDNKFKEIAAKFSRTSKPGQLKVSYTEITSNIGDVKIDITKARGFTSPLKLARVKEVRPVTSLFYKGEQGYVPKMTPEELRTYAYEDLFQKVIGRKPTITELKPFVKLTSEEKIISEGKLFTPKVYTYYRGGFIEKIKLPYAEAGFQQMTGDFTKGITKQPKTALEKFRWLQTPEGKTQALRDYSARNLKRLGTVGGEYEITPRSDILSNIYGGGQVTESVYAGGVGGRGMVSDVFVVGRTPSAARMTLAPQATMTSLGLFPKFGLAPTISTGTIIQTRNISATILAGKLLQQQVPRQIQTPQLIQVMQPITRTIQVPRTRQIQVPTLQLRQIQLPQQKQIQLQKPQQPQIPRTPPKPPVPGETTFFLPSIEETPSAISKAKEMKLRAAYQVLLRRRGKFVSISKKPLPMGEALKLGVTKTKAGVAQTFKLVPKGQTTMEDITYKVPGRYFTTLRRPQPLTFVERRGLTLTERPEVKELLAFKSIKRRQSKFRLF